MINAPLACVLNERDRLRWLNFRVSFRVSLRVSGWGAAHDNRWRGGGGLAVGGERGALCLSRGALTTRCLSVGLGGLALELRRLALSLNRAALSLD